MAPFSRLAPKELAPIGSVPALQLVLEEIAAAGLVEVGIVVRPGKAELIERCVEQTGPRADGPDPRRLEVTWIEQPQPRGLGDAILCAQGFLRREPFALLLPDNLLLGAEHRLADLTRLHAETGRDVLGVLELGAEQSGEYGNCGLIDYRVPDPSRPRVLELLRLHDKGPGRLLVGEGEVKRRTCGRYVCTPELLDELDSVREEMRRHGADGELDEVPAYQRLIERRGAVGYVLAGPLFDVGYPLGYLAACAFEYRRQREAWDRSERPSRV